MKRGCLRSCEKVMARSVCGVNKQCSRHHHRLEQQHTIDGIKFRNYSTTAMPFTRNNGNNFIAFNHSTGRFNATTIPRSSDGNNNNNNISQRTLCSTPRGEKDTDVTIICQLFREIGDRIELTDRDRKPKTTTTVANPPNENASSSSTSNNNNTTVVQRKSAASLASEFCESYLSLPDMKRYPSSSSSPSEKSNDAKQDFLKLLLDEEYSVNQKSILSAMENHVDVVHNSSHRSIPLRPSDIVRMRELCTPQYEDIFHSILGSAQKDLGVAFLVMLRRDIRDVIRYTKFIQQDKKEGSRRQQLPQSEDMALDSHHRHSTKLQMLERNIQTILTSLFRPGVLNLRRITYQDTPASIIEQIAFREAVHPLQSLEDLRTRLGPGRRCFAFFHPSLPNKPLVFVHVALLHEIPTGMDDLKHASESDERTTCAAFYSITNTERGLAGVDLGNHLIKSVVQVLRNEFPKLKSFCTLSPIPKFRNWLEGKIVRYHEGLVMKKQLQLEEKDINGDNGDDYSLRFMDDCLFSTTELKQLQNIFSSETYLLDLLETLKSPNWQIKTSETITSSSSDSSSSGSSGSRGETNSNGRCPSPWVDELQPILMKLAAYYLTIETHHGRPLCPVAKFHIRNGAEMYRLNYMADTSAKGMRNSCGMMINYRYSLDEIEENRVRYEISGEAVVKDGVHCWLEPGLDKRSRL